MASSGDLSHTSEVLNDRLQCYLCKMKLRVGKYRWYRCLGNHQICEDCTQLSDDDLNRGGRGGLLFVSDSKNGPLKLEFCRCGKSISSEFCKMTEELLKSSTMRFKCANVDRGCATIFGEKDMKEHEIECFYRRVTCPDIGCRSVISINTLTEHIEEKCHVTNFYAMSKGEKIQHKHSFEQENYAKGNFYFTPMRIQFDKRIFFFSGVQYSNSETLNCWIQLVGSSFEAKNYYYTLEINGVDSNIKTTYTGPVQAIDKDSKWILAKNKCFATNFENFKAQFIDDQLILRFSIKITNMKEEFKDDNEESGISDEN